MYSLLTDELIAVRCKGHSKSQRVTLPVLFELLAQDSVEDFPELVAYEAQAWYQFIVQLAVIAKTATAPQSILASMTKDQWLNSLTSLTSEDSATAWSLVVENPELPAFLQPPLESLKDLKSVDASDELTTLVKAKNHDRKKGQVWNWTPGSWIFSLVNFQTMQGYSGSKKNQIVRMNGGFGSRPLVELRPAGGRWGMRWSYSVDMLQASREKILEKYQSIYKREGGVALTWLVPWKGDSQISMKSLDPFFIECSRRVRLVADGKTINAQSGTSNKPRIDGSRFKGVIGDPWIPINLKASGGQGALTVSSSGFDYRLSQKILLSKEEIESPLTETLENEKVDIDLEVYMSALTRGQGKTEGLHERTIPLPRTIISFFKNVADEAEASGYTLQEDSKDMIKTSGEIRKSLRRCLLVFMYGSDQNIRNKSDADGFLQEFEASIDASFFEILFKSTDRFDRIKEWEQLLKETCLRIAESVWKTVSPPADRREKARVDSERILHFGFRKHLMNLYEVNDE